MANKFLNFSNLSVDNQLSTSLESLEKYKDLSMDSVANTKNIDFPNASRFRVAKNVNVEAIKGSLKNCFRWIVGQRILLPEFGTNLKRLLYEGITEFNKELITEEIRHSISQWETRISILNIQDISTREDTETNTVRFNVIYTIPSLSNKQYNYSFYYNKSE